MSVSLLANCKGRGAAFNPGGPATPVTEGKLGAATALTLGTEAPWSSVTVSSPSLILRLSRMSSIPLLSSSVSPDALAALVEELFLNTI